MQRTRILQEYNEADIYTTRVYDSANKLISTTNTEFKSDDVYHKVIDNVTKNWKQIIASGGVVNSPLSDIKSVVSYTGAFSNLVNSNGSARTEIDNNPIIYRAKVLGTLSLKSGSALSSYSDEMETAVARAKQLVLANIERAPFDFSEDALELGKTFRTLIQPLSLARNLSNEFHDRYKFYSSGKHVSVSQSIAKAWLEVRFGYRPIMISLENILTGYNTVVAKRPQVERHAIRQKVPVSVSETTTLVYKNSADSVNYTCKAERSGVAYGSAGLIYEVRSPTRDWRWKYGVRNKDLVRAVYNVMPYSWVVDRFININDSLRGLMNIADSSVRVVAAWEKRYHDVTALEQVTGASYTAGYFSPAPIGSSELVLRLSKERIPWVPGVTDTFPVFHPEKLSTFSQVFDLASLVLVRLKPTYKPGNYLT